MAVTAQHRSVVELSAESSRPSSDRRDDGFTLIETLMVMAVMSIIITALAVSFTVIVRVSPDTELRIDDARSTRGLSTWLAHDTTSAPRFQPEQPVGGIDTTASRDSCGGGPGANMIHFTWTEDSFLDRVFTSSYRFVVDGDEGRIVRVTCSRTTSSSFGAPSIVNLTSGLDPATPPTVTLNRVDPIDPLSEVESVDFRLTATSGAAVLVQTGSRNPTDGF